MENSVPSQALYQHTTIGYIFMYSGGNLFLPLSLLTFRPPFGIVWEQQHMFCFIGLCCGLNIALCHPRQLTFYNIKPGFRSVVCYGVLSKIKKAAADILCSEFLNKVATFVSESLCTLITVRQQHSDQVISFSHRGDVVMFHLLNACLSPAQLTLGWRGLFTT